MAGKIGNKPINDAERERIIDAWLNNKHNSAKALSVLTGISAGRCDAVITKYLMKKSSKMQ